MSIFFNKKFLVGGAVALAVILAVINYQQIVAPPASSQPQVQGAATTTDAATLTATFFDVGQGDAALIVTPNRHDILIDGGPDDDVVKKLGEALPFYDHHLDYVILTHPHADHVTGLNEILNRYEVGTVVMTGVLHTAAVYLDFLRIVKDKNIPVVIIDRPQTINFDDGVAINFLFPFSSFASQRIGNLNDSSIAAQFVYGSTTLLMTGDLEDEEKLATTTLAANVYKVGHHGSTNANDTAFLVAVHPAYAIISVGAGNSYGLPSYRVIRNLERLGATVWRTDEQGDATFISDGISFRPKS